jgi:hypothetical protein
MVSEKRKATVFGFLCGLYFLSVGGIAMYTTEWPVYLTLIQLDGLHVLLSIFGRKAATYLLGSTMCFLGLLIWALCARAARRG